MIYIICLATVSFILTQCSLSLYLDERIQEAKTPFDPEKYLASR